ncbi:MAG: glycosyltransferase family 2 protein [Nanoarchaeota archaeon]
MLISIIILNYNGARTLKKCLDSVRNLNFKDYEVIVVDNDSSDNSDKIVKEYGFKLIRNKKNYGYAEGNNIGIRKAKGKYIFLLNNDAYADKNCLQYLVSAVKSKDVGAGGAKIYYKDSKDVWFSGAKEIIGGIFNTHVNKSSCDYVSGCAILLKRDVLDRVGLLDKKYYLYYEEVDLCKRIRNKGYKVVYEPKAVVYHDIQKSKVSSHEVYYMNRNRVLYCLKYTKNRLLFTILDFFVYFPLFIGYQVLAKPKTLFYIREILKARIDSLKL